MRLLMLFGPQAVGKMTVGQALTRLTPLRLFHNHMSIEPVLALFGDYHRGAVEKIRAAMFEEFLKTDHYGMIFTFQWCFNLSEDWEYARRIAGMFEESGAQVDWVELCAPLEVRLKRNTTENRLKEKPSKRNTVLSESFIRHAQEVYRDTSLPGEIPFERYLRIDNSELSAEETAERIVQHFGLLRKKG